MGCRFSSIGKMVAQLSGNTRFPTTPCAGRGAVFRGIPRLLRSGVLALSPYATKMGRSLLLAGRFTKQDVAQYYRTLIQAVPGPNRISIVDLF
jgi:hypothetical protein